jgi:hypothetical protein
MKHLILFSLISIALTANAASTSAYSDLTTCKVLTSSENDPNAPIDYFTSVCQGREGFDVHLDGGDLRSWISLSLRNKADLIAENISFSFESGQFSNIAGSKLEWRYRDNKLNALIVRMSGQDPENINKELSTLAVIRIDKNNPSGACVIGVVNAHQANANLLARAIADSARTQCLNN